MMASAPNCSDTDRGRRTGNQEDYRNFLRLAQMHNVLHVTGGYPVEPVDIHASVRHLDCIQDYITLTDKAYCIYSLGEDRVSDAIEMTRIAHGLTHDQMRDQACMFSIINTNSPLQLDIPMMQGVMALAEMGQPVVITPFTLAGAMAPITIAGAVTLQNAEALAGVALSQMVRPGAPVMYGGFTSNVDMKTGAPGRTIWVKATPARASAFCRVTAPAIVTGAIAPASVKGVITTGWPISDNAITPCIIGISSCRGEFVLMIENMQA